MICYSKTIVKSCWKSCKKSNYASKQSSNWFPNSQQNPSKSYQSNWPTIISKTISNLQTRSICSWTWNSFTRIKFLISCPWRIMCVVWMNKAGKRAAWRMWWTRLVSLWVRRMRKKIAVRIVGRRRYGLLSRGRIPTGAVGFRFSKRFNRSRLTYKRKNWNIPNAHSSFKSTWILSCTIAVSLTFVATCWSHVPRTFVLTITLSVIFAQAHANFQQKTVRIVSFI